MEKKAIGGLIEERIGKSASGLMRIRFRKYNHNHDPATGRFASGGGSGSGSSSGGGHGSGKTYYSGRTKEEQRQWYKETEKEFEAKLEEAKNHPLKDERPEAYARNVQQWEHRLELLREKMKEFEEGE